jgi:hypothetical protein
MSGGNEPAFPQPTNHAMYFVGLSKREYFAAMALLGIIQNCRDGMRPDDVPHAARDAVMFADALLSELDKAGGQ